MITGTWALPIKRHLTGQAPGWTDYKNINILNHITGREETLILTHESAHVWLCHDRRAKKLDDRKLSAIACELEIARAIYSEDDNDVILSSTTDLKGGFTNQSNPEIPADLIYMEDIYDWLVKNAPDTEANDTGCQRCKMEIEKSKEPGGGDSGDNGTPEQDDNGTPDSATPEDLVNQVKEQVNQASSIAQLSYPKQVIKKSFIASEIAALSHGARKRLKSYARPNRRENNLDFSKGSKKTIVKPKIIIYVDRSASFTPEKTLEAETKLKQVLTRYSATLESSTLYFTSGNLWDKEPPTHGDTPYHLVHKHINENKPALAIVITDDDPVYEKLGPIKARTIVVPIACNSTKFAQLLNLKEDKL